MWGRALRPASGVGARERATVALLAVFAALLIPACGGDDEGDKGQAESQSQHGVSTGRARIDPSAAEPLVLAAFAAATDYESTQKVRHPILAPLQVDCSGADCTAQLLSPPLDDLVEGAQQQLVAVARYRVHEEGSGLVATLEDYQCAQTAGAQTWCADLAAGEPSYSEAIVPTGPAQASTTENPSSSGTPTGCPPPTTLGSWNNNIGQVRVAGLSCAQAEAELQAMVEAGALDQIPGWSCHQGSAGEEASETTCTRPDGDEISFVASA